MKTSLAAHLRIPFIALLVAAATACSAMDKTPDDVLVAGATGQTGQLIVKQLQQQGYRVHALVRETSKAREQLGPDVALVLGDVKEPETLAAAMNGIDAVISSVGARGKEGPDRPEMVDYMGVKNLVDAAKAAGVRQFVLLSSRGVTHEDHPLNRMFGNVLVYKRKGEDHLRASGLAYTIIRPGGLLNEPAGQGNIVFEQGDRRFSGSTLTIPREDVATVCVQALRNPQAKFRTFEVHRENGAATTDWKAKFASLKPDAG